MRSNRTIHCGVVSPYLSSMRMQDLRHKPKGTFLLPAGARVEAGLFLNKFWDLVLGW